MVYDKATPKDLLPKAQSGSMSEHLVRLGRLKQLQRERGMTDAELARQCKRSPQQLNSWWNNKRMIGERLARALEEVLQLPRYWLDERPESMNQLVVREGSYKYSATPVKVHAAPHRAEALPVVPWDSLLTMLTEPNATLPAAHERLETFAQASRAAKFVQMPDDSMLPVFQPGDHILFDPVEAPRAGDTVLVRIPSGEHFVRTFRPRTAQAWDAAPLNTNYEPLSAQTDGVKVVAVMVEHRRYRASS